MKMCNSTTTRMPERERWFDEKLRNKNYNYFGDAYDDSKYHELAREWNKETQDGQDYLRFVKQASKTQWIHLRLLADFMQIGKMPREWKKDKDLSGPTKDNIKIRVLEYFADDQNTEVMHCIDTAQCKRHSETESLEGQIEARTTNGASFRLYVVEDLSAEVIELLGTKFGIEPDFFRAHIVDYAWYNIRDRWRDNQPLELVRRRRNWWQMRYVAARYFENEGDLNDAATEAKESFNILRRPDNDKSRGWWDIVSGPSSSGGPCRSAAVALTRSRATFWLKPNASDKETAIGVLLLDPTVSNGFPLWRGHGNFHPVPWPSAIQDKPSEWPSWTSPSHEDSCKRSFFEDFVYWARRPGLSALGLEEAPREHIPVLVLLNLVGSEWLIMCEYIKTRLNQIDMETIDPNHLSDKKLIDTTLEKLHIWRRLIPLYREMVAETLQHFFGLSRSKLNMTQSQDPSGQSATTGCPNCSQTAASLKMCDIKVYEEDYKLVLAHLEEYQSRIDRLTSVVTAVMAVEDTRRAITDARNIGFLTWLATFFIPFGVFSGIFSMQKREDMSIDTIQLYFAVTLPFVVVTLVIAWTLHSSTAAIWFNQRYASIIALFKRNTNRRVQGQHKETE
ncbi:hypothetical protein KVR01_012197 [Diaporthe batatas]|uniref:uncharacterized protein n=1 Tax=Diaporthe batatas TaxID=748121 RepID=UPI001D04E659|nr:uncharacterized protein KVR01_012197 [Diaporthe batatas]KAG8157925.1 hypothetical protein KVR01_012197 [Diaporthe batatas]